MVKKEISNKKKRLQAIKAQLGEPETLFNNESAAEDNRQQVEVQSEEEHVNEEKVVKRTKKTIGKKLKNSRSLIDAKKEYPIDEAIKMLKKASYTSFVGTVELHLVLKEKGVEGGLMLPNGTGREQRILAFVHDEATSVIAKQAGAGIVGSKDLTEAIQSNKLKPGKDFDVVVAHPQAMVFVTPLAKILGPKKMMPNPKNNTVGANLNELVKEIKKGKLSYKAESANPYLIHTIAGKIDFKTEKLVENINEIFNNIGLQKIKKAYLSSTMSPSITVKLN